MGALYVLIVLIALIVVALSIPVDFVFKFSTSDFSRRKLQFRCFFGLLRFDLHNAEKKEETKKLSKTRSASGGEKKNEKNS